MKQAALAGLAALLGAVALLAVSFWRRPLRWLEALERQGLSRAGLSRTEASGPRGRLVYWRGGSGPTVLLLHGVNHQAGAWSRVVPALLPGHRLVIPDLPGHGDSEPATGSLSLHDVLAGLAELLRLEAPGPVRLVGNSFGGFLALLYARQHPERVVHVVLVNGAAISTGMGSVNLLPRDRDQARRTLGALTGLGIRPPPGFILDDLVRRGPGSPLARLLAAGYPADALDGRLGEVTTPVTLVWGDADRLLPRSYAEAVVAALPASRIEFLPGCGHVPMRECPGTLGPALRRALGAPPQ